MSSGEFDLSFVLLAGWLLLRFLHKEIVRSERTAMPITGMIAPIATLAPVLIPDDGLFEVGEGKVGVFVNVEGPANEVVIEGFADLEDSLDSNLTEANDSNVLAVGLPISVGMFITTFTPCAQVEKPRYSMNLATALDWKAVGSALGGLVMEISVCMLTPLPVKVMQTS